MFAYFLVGFLHIGGATLLVGGIGARHLARSTAKRATDPAALVAMFQAADPIERELRSPAALACSSSVGSWPF